MTRVIQRHCISGINIFISPKKCNNTKSIWGRINIFCTLLDITEVQSWLDFGSFNICPISSLRQTPQGWDYHIYCFWFLLVLCCSCHFTRRFFLKRKNFVSHIFVKLCLISMKQKLKLIPKSYVFLVSFAANIFFVWCLNYTFGHLWLLAHSKNWLTHDLHFLNPE